MCAVHSFNDSAKMNIGINKAELDSALAMVREFEDRVGVSTKLQQRCSVSNSKANARDPRHSKFKFKLKP